MTADERSAVEAPLSAQPFTQSNIQNLIFAAIESSRQRELSQIDDTDLTWLHRRFEAPERFGEAQGKLERHGVVLLDGEPGSGRRAAAKMLLRLHVDAEHRFCVLPAELADSSSEIDVSNISPGDLLLLDLSSVERAAYDVLRDALAGLRAIVRRQEAKLVVILHTQWEALTEHDETQQYRVWIGKPDPERVVQRHLAGEGVPVGFALPQVNGLKEKLRKSSMAKLARFAAVTQRLFDRAGGDRDLAADLRLALTASADRTPELKTDLDHHKDGWSRALLFVIAMLEGAHLNVIFEANQLLLAKIGHPEEAAPSLERPSLLTRLPKIKAEITDTRSVRFKEIGYGEAVVSYFWDNYLDLHSAFRDWVDELVRMSSLNRGERAALAERVAEQCLRTDHPNLLVELSENWVAAKPEELAPVIRSLLRIGLADIGHGRVFRRKIYDWAKEGRQPRAFTAVLVDLCGVELARSYPEEALTRLRHLARGPVGERDGLALAALSKLACSDLRLFRRLLDRLCSQPATDRRPADFEIFFRLVDPGRLLRTDNRGRPYLLDSSVRNNVVGGWIDALSSAVGYDWPPELENWLNRCSSLPTAQALYLLRVVVEAAGGDGAKLAEIYVVARDWANSGPARGARTALAFQFGQLIDEAQGVGVGPSGLRSREEQ
ncbi:hypothetical protein [Amycolatopsis sp. PS_44_ISF1]|uniref:hypothetical protein n=1 Tax=Amycolatopsis sp. PS_44_ISF1 TaxID=2974917 RepID=UPI0028DE3D66|nr:hypothetical protein [Amycolatopsis sp. PS_44_ISF1]MDT8915439.1 hypothetical protein [Amycolatopsis sp. PS_44_ISF1]